jgi:hypothetical protein
MKSTLLIVVVFALLLAACQTATPTVSEAPIPVETQVETPAPVDDTQEPSANEPYPGVDEPSGEDPDAAPAYPGPEQGTTPVEWDEATELILDGKVAQVTQYDSLMVILVLKDGKTVSTREPVIDEVFNVIEQCGDPCEDIEIPSN